MRASMNVLLVVGYSLVISLSPPVYGSENLQRFFGISDAYWHEPLPSIIQLYDAGDFKQGDALLDQWLVDDFYAAMKVIPELDNVVFHYSLHSPAPVYEKHLRHISGAERIALLGQLGFHSDAVRFVTVRVLSQWWFLDRGSILTWIVDSPSLFEHAYWEEFLLGVLDPQSGRKSAVGYDEFEALAAVFFSLNKSDERRVTYFDFIFQTWVKVDPKAAAEFIAVKKDIRADIVLDKARTRLAYQRAEKHEFDQALSLLSGVEFQELRDWTLRDFSLIIEPSDVDVFQKWLNVYGCTQAQACAQIDEQLRELNVGQGDEK